MPPFVQQSCEKAKSIMNSRNDYSAIEVEREKKENKRHGVI